MRTLLPVVSTARRVLAEVLVVAEVVGVAVFDAMDQDAGRVEIPGSRVADPPAVVSLDEELIGNEAAVERKSLTALTSFFNVRTWGPM
jgi:hypothetical protein